mgnify:CR=1 FL=1
MSVDTAKTVTELLRETVVSGSGKRAETEYFDAAGKTATAQSGWFEVRVIFIYMKNNNF